MRGRSILTALGLGVAIVSTTLSARALESRAAGRERTESLLYLPNGRYLKAASLGQAPLLADAIYLWAIQFYSDYDRADRRRYVRHVFGNVIAELDPNFIDAYWLGALILIIESHDLDGGLALLEQGATANPTSWILPYLAGWESYLAGRTEAATAYFARSASVPGAPLVARRMYAGVTSRTGDARAALALWLELLDDPASDDHTRAVAERKARELRVRIDLDTLRASIERFRSETGRAPRSLEELRLRGYLAVVPVDPEGRPYGYDASTGAIRTTAGRLLGEGT